MHGNQETLRAGKSGSNAAAPGGVLALDISSRTGWAYGHADAPPIFDTWTLGKFDELGRACSSLAASLEAAIALHAPRLILFEAPIPKQQTSARGLIYLCGVVEMIAYEQSVRAREEHAATVRKAVLGRGGSFAIDRKLVVIGWCREQGWKPKDDNAADALVLLRYALLMEEARRRAPHRGGL